MKSMLFATLLVTGMLGANAALAQASAPAPAGSTGVCKDGTYTTNATKSGACSGHKGVKDWYGANAGATAAASAPAAAPAVVAPAAPAAVAKPAVAIPATGHAPSASAAPAAGGGPGQVWVNSSSKVYHCAGSKHYGTTKAGQYMTEAAAKAAGNHADHGKACS